MKMKRLATGILMISTIMLTSCFEDYNDRYLLTDNYVEFDEATTLTRATGKPYPIVSRTINPDVDTVFFKVNLIGRQRDSDVTLSFRVVESESTAVEDRDFRFPEGKSYVIPRKTSIGTIKVVPTEAGEGTNILVLELVASDDIAIAENYKQIGIRCVYD